MGVHRASRRRLLSFFPEAGQAIGGTREGNPTALIKGGPLVLVPTREQAKASDDADTRGTLVVNVLSVRVELPKVCVAFIEIVAAFVVIHLLFFAWQFSISHGPMRRVWNLSSWLSLQSWALEKWSENI